MPPHLNYQVRRPYYLKGVIMDIDEIIEMLKNPPETGLDETIYDNLNDTYRNDLSIRDAKVQELETQIAERDAVIASLKSQNYDLVMKVDAGKSSDSDADPDPDVESDSEPDDGDIDSLFKDDEKE